MSASAKVGLFMVIVLIILGFFILKIEDIPLESGAQAKKVEVLFDSVAGLDVKSAVRVAGVRVGKVDSIRLTPEGRALVTLAINENVHLHQGATAKVTELGLLGEKYIELDPGAAGAPAFSGGQPIPGSQVPSLTEVTGQVSQIATDVKAITASMRTALGDQEGERRLVEIVENIRAITTQVRLLIQQNQENVNATASNFRAITDNLRVEIPKVAASIDRLTTSLGDTVGDNREDVRSIVENLKALSADLRTTNDNLGAITGQIRSGQGTVGKLIYSDEAHDKLTSALASVESGVDELKNTLGRADRLGLDLGIRSDYYSGLDKPETGAFSGNSRSAISLDLRPNPENNRFYRVELADDPRGKKSTKVIDYTITLPDGSKQTITTEEEKLDRSYLISAQAGWALDNWDLRLGLFDSTGGVGADYAIGDRLKITGEAFDFGKQYAPDPHLRLYGQWVISKQRKNFPELFLTTGIDNPLNDTAVTFGGGIRWSDEDLKYLLGSIPVKP